MGSGREDWISSMPDEILGKILSLLPIKVAASTSVLSVLAVLSKRWKYLLLHVDTICLDESVYKEEATSGSHCFSDFVDNTFALLSNSSIKKFTLRLLHRHDREITKRWIWTAMEHALSELHLHALTNWSVVCIKTKLFTSTTLVKLTLSGAYDLKVERVYFPALKSLSLVSTDIDHDNYCRLIEGCPVLEELYRRDGNYPLQKFGHVREVQSASIKRLVVFKNHPKYRVDHQLVYLEAPSLVYFDYSSHVSEQYEVVDLDLLVEARLNLKLWVSTNDYDYVDEPHTPIFGDVTNLIAGISNITTLHLSSHSLEAFHFCCKSMPVFNNLLNLSIESHKKIGWQVMPLLLKSSPNLQTLVIKGLKHRVTNKCGDACTCVPKTPRQGKRKKIKKKDEVICCLWTCQVKELKILDYTASLRELNQMRHFLGKLKWLQTVKISPHVDSNDSECLRANLMSLPRVSSKCNIQFM